MKRWGSIAAVMSAVVLSVTFGAKLEGCADRFVMLEGEGPSMEQWKELDARIAAIEAMHGDLQQWRLLHEHSPPPEGHNEP